MNPKMLSPLLDGVANEIARRDDLIRQMATALTELMEMSPRGTDVKPASRLVNRAEELVGGMEVKG